MTMKGPREEAAVSRRGLWDLLMVTLLGLPLITPLLRWLEVACTHDGHVHYNRVVAIRHAWENGLFFSRWLPDLVFGYGYPLFVYRETLPLYLTHWLHLGGLPLPAATNLFYILCILAAGWFTYLWVRDVFGARAGIVAAVAYMAAPYQLIDALVRGNQVESMALALMPLVLWAGRRFLVRGGATWFLVTTLGLAALALSHNISLLLFTPALGLYLLAVGWIQRMPIRSLLGRLLLVLGLGLGVTSFYTGTALLEKGEVQLNLVTATRNNNFRFNFTSGEELLAPVPAENPTQINPPLPFRVGWAPAALAMLGVLSLAWNRQREQRGHIVVMAGGACIFLLLTLPFAEPLWASAPLIRFVQFPWRLVGRAALPIAVLAGAPFASPAGEPVIEALRRRARAGVGPGSMAFLAAVALLLIEAMPLLYPSYCRVAAYPTIENVHAYESRTGMLGADPVGSLLPVTVERRPDGSPLLADYAAGRRPERFDERALPAGAEVVSAAYGPNEGRVVVESPTGFEARYLTFAFPGWRATVDGERAAITPGDPEGLITFPVPAGRHTITVAWTLTPLRALLTGVSVLALLGVVVAAFVLQRGGWHLGQGPGESEDPPSSRLDEDEGVPIQGSKQRTSAPPGALRKDTRLLLLGLGLLLLGGKLLVVDRMETPLRRAAPPPVEQETAIRAGGLRLAGYNLSRTVVPAGETFDVHLAWQVETTPAAAYQSNVWLVGPEGLAWSDKETYRPRLYEDAPATTTWAPGQWAWDSREVHVLPGTPPGRYEIVLTLFGLEGLQPLTLVGEEGALGPTAVIGQVEVVRPEQPPSLTPQHALEAQIDGLTLLGYDQDRAEAAPGDPVLLTLFWERGVEGGAAAGELSLQLRGEDGRVAHAWTTAPARDDYPPEAWAAGERVRGQHLLRLPARLESGAYRLWLEDVALGSISVQAPERTFSPPPYERTASVSFGGRAELVGYSLAPDVSLGTAGGALPASLTVRLVWQGVAEMPTSYRVFVHLVDEGGQIVAQSDGEPAGWTRATTGWAPGEYVVDEHTLALPDEAPGGPFSLRVGLYDPETGERLPAGDGDFATLMP